MKTETSAEVQYWLNLDKQPVLKLNPLIGQEVSLLWEGVIHCISCGREIQKTFGQGFCYPCFRDAPDASPCILRPELCEAHLGRGRDVAWEEANHNQPHVVYLAQTSDVKVGVTRATQVPTRWIDQGAWRTLAIANTPYRQLAGMIEVELKQYISDRTDWRRMLMGVNGTDDLLSMRDEILSFLPANFSDYLLPDQLIQTFKYPVPSYPQVLKGHDLEKDRHIKKVLTGIRGQYLMFDHKYVINLRKYSGYQVAFECEGTDYRTSGV